MNRRMNHRGASTLLALASLLACGTSKPPAPAASSSLQETRAWSWHRMGDYIVIDGDLDHATQLILSGPSTHVTTAADFGPVHWELRSPVVGEAVSLKDAEGRTLASWVMKGKGSDEAPVVAHATRLSSKSAARIIKATPPTPRALPPAPNPGPKIEPKPAHPPKVEPATPEQRKPLPTPPKPIPPPPAVPTALSGTWPGAGSALDLTRGPKNQKVILLSFDGGSSDEAADEILATLETRHLRTTMFLTGAFIERFPEVVRRIVADGHEVGNHTFDHPHFAPDFHRDPRWTEPKVQDELLRADEAFFRLTGRPMDPFWRSPYGEHTKEIRAWAEALGYRHVGWSEGADSLDWATPKERRLYRSGDAILKKLHARMEKNNDGLIVLMHLGSGRPEADRPSAGLGAFIDQAQAEGWRFVTASEMLRLMGQPSWNRDRRAALLQQTSTSGGR